jgi:hypothetical protein
MNEHFNWNNLHGTYKVRIYIKVLYVVPIPPLPYKLLPSWFDRSYNVRWVAQIVSLPSMQFPSSLFYSLRPRVKHSHKKVLRPLQPVFCPSVRHQICQSQWPWSLCLMRGYAAAFLWDCGFESRRGHGCLSIVSVVCCQVDSSSVWSVVLQTIATECGVSEYVCVCVCVCVIVVGCNNNSLHLQRVGRQVRLRKRDMQTKVQF